MPANARKVFGWFCLLFAWRLYPFHIESRARRSAYWECSIENSGTAGAAKRQSLLGLGSGRRDIRK